MFATPPADWCGGATVGNKSSNVKRFPPLAQEAGTRKVPLPPTRAPSPDELGVGVVDANAESVLLMCSGERPGGEREQAEPGAAGGSASVAAEAANADGPTEERGAGLPNPPYRGGDMGNGPAEGGTPESEEEEELLQFGEGRAVTR